MGVHKDMTKHVNKINDRINAYYALDGRREYHIEEAVSLCQRGLPFTTDQINEITKQMNEIAKHGVVPMRKLVTTDMVREYVDKLAQQS